MTDLETARARLAECETLIAQGLGGPYAEQNLATHRARVARLEAAVSAPTPAASIPPAPTLAAPKPAPAPVITGTREGRLHRIAAAFDTDERTLEAAIDDGTTPDEFAVVASNEAVAKAKAAEILAA